MFSTISTPVYVIFVSLKNLVLEIHVKSPHPKSKTDKQLFLYINSFNKFEQLEEFSNEEPGPDKGMLGHHYSIFFLNIYSQI